MNIKHYLSAAAALSLFAACSEYDPGLSETAVDYTDSELAVLQEYDLNFVTRYGNVDPNHTWGFGAVASEDTRTTRAINVNRNNWVIRKDEPKYVEDENGNLVIAKGEDGQDLREVTWVPNTAEFGENAADVVIPGFPSSIDGKYYTEEGVFDSFEQMEEEGVKAVHPIGDVTEEEILQVSQWFRTHKNPTSLDFNYNAIFFQEISQDVDRIASDPDEGAWDALYDEADDNQVKQTCNYGMDYLCVKGADYADWEHINNYNNYSSDFYTDEDGEVHYNGNHISEENPNSDEQDLSIRKIKYWTSNDGSKAVDFAFHGSHDDAIHNTWVVCKVPYKIGNQWYEGTYLAFDYEMDKTGKGGGKVYTDGYYSNWIIKLAEGVEIDDPEPEHNWYRIMCEDLGDTDDFDFNDLVFDVYYTGTEAENNIVAHIRVQASGGTMPIYLAYDKNEAYEAHKLLGQDVTNIPINVGGKKANPVDIEISVTSLDPNDIPIWVNTIDAGAPSKTTLLPKSGKGEHVAPQKICIPGNTTKWLKERKQIESAYTHFDAWVQKESSDYNYDGATPWNTTDVNPTNLYNP